MSDLSKDEIDFARHALGLSNAKTGYRNYYMAGGDDVLTGRALVAKGLAVEYPAKAPLRPDPTFLITRAGFEAVRKPGEKMDREETAKFKRIVTFVEAPANRSPAMSETDMEESGIKPVDLSGVVALIGAEVEGQALALRECAATIKKLREERDAWEARAEHAWKMWDESGQRHVKACLEYHEEIKKLKDEVHRLKTDARALAKHVMEQPHE